MEDTVFQVGQAEESSNPSVLSNIESVDIAAMLASVDPEVSLPPKLYRIGDVIQYSGLSRQTIHNYTAMGLIRESQWTKTGHRLYDEDVFRYLALIKQLRMKYSLAQIKQMLSQVTVS